MDTSRKRALEGLDEEDIDVDSYKATAYKKRATETDCTKLDDKFKKDTENSLTKARKLKQCSFDHRDVDQFDTKKIDRRKVCNIKDYKDPEHFKEFSHKYHCNTGNINNFKEDTDTFLENTYNIYKCNVNFSTAWHTKVGADTGKEKNHLKTFEYKQYDTFIFSMLANIALHLDEYEEDYGSEFLQAMLFAIETNDNTGLFPIEQYSPISNIFTTYAPIERETGKIDYRLSNTTLRGLIENRLKKKLETEAGGTKKRSTLKRSTLKRKNKTKRKSTKKHTKQIKRK